MRPQAIVCLLAGAFAAGSAYGQSEKFNHAQWSLSFSQTAAAPGAEILAKLEARIDPEWHMYSLTTPPGPIATTIKVVEGAAVESVTWFEPAPVRKYDPNFKSDTETYEGTQVFLGRIRLKKDAAAGTAAIVFEPRYQTCSGTSCIPPRTRRVSGTIEMAAGAPAAALAIPAGYLEAKQRAAAGSSADAGLESGLGAFLALAFGVGLAAIFTPCVFPMIPITMSYFVGQRGGLSQAITFCLGIVVLFTGLGLLATVALGPAGVVQLGGNPWVNGFIALVFFTFGLSLLGAFEITIPSGLLTKLNTASGQGGFFGALLMGLTFALASFACVGPFMGTLLAASVTGGKTRPVLGMAVFSSGLALPFFLLALFPAWLTKMPRSGEWLARVKVVMGFLVLAFMLKYLYSLDAVLQTGLLTRERFLAAAVVLLILPGLYLLGLLRLPGVSRDAEVGVSRLLIASLFVICGVSLLPGMFGSKLGEIEAWIPPPAGNDAGGLTWIENDLDGAFAKAKAEGRMVLVNFTGYACTNCHWMKANMFTRPAIAGPMKNMVLVDLYTDGTDAASAANQKLEEDKFQTVAIPFYVLYDADRNVVASFPSATRDEQQYLAFLNTKGEKAPAQEASAALPETAALQGAPFHTLAGAPLSAAAWQGKVTVVNYWATWCIPCRQEIPEFNRMQREMKDVEIVGIAMDEGGAEAIAAFTKQVPVTYTLALGTGALEQLPVTVVLDRNGRTVQRFEGFTAPATIRAAIAKARNG